VTMDTLSLVVHVAAGLLAILAGYVAIFAPKGGDLHRRSGTLFVYAMIVMGVGAVVVGALRGTEGLSGGPLAAYFVITALTTVRPVDRRIDLALLAGVLSISALSYAGAMEGRSSIGGAPVGMIVFVATVALLAGLGDIRALIAPPAGARRIARHLWRMCFGFWFATGSFFLGQMDEFPAWLQKPALMAIPAMLPPVLMFYWLWRTRVRKSLAGLELRRDRASTASAAAAASFSCPPQGGPADLRSASS